MHSRTLINGTFLIAALAAIGCSATETDSPIECTTNLDCITLDPDANHCNGGFSCNNGVCEASGNPIECTAESCKQSKCDPATGLCKPDGNEENGSICNSDPCLRQMTCTDGICGGGETICEDDGNPCTEPVCNPNTLVCGQKKLADFASCNDGNACTEKDVCVAGSCAGVPKKCTVETDGCVIAVCDSKTGECGTEARPDGASCENLDLCRINASCKEGVCTPGAAKCQQDNNPCTITMCNKEDGNCYIDSAPDGGQCNDNNGCTTKDQCSNGLCTGTPIKCPDSINPCSTFQCDKSTGSCLPQPIDGQPSCDDKDGCTENDKCINGSCEGSPKTCADDGNECTSESCINNACTAKPLNDGISCSDGNACTVNSVCINGACDKGEPKCQDDGNSCTLETCDPVKGSCTQVTLKDGTPCGTGDPCTAESVCEAGKCVGGKPLLCPDDGNSCTQEICIAQEGGCKVINQPENALCDDGDNCTTGEKCIQATCQGGLPKQCKSDGTGCTFGSCDPDLGCVIKPLNEGDSCDDGNECTDNDVCSQGICAGGAKTCVPSSDCVQVECDDLLGCVESPLADGLECDDQNACTLSTVCLSGKCEANAVVECQATVQTCLKSVCNPVTGNCDTASADNGKACDDNNPCTTVDTCENGQCLGGGETPCDELKKPCQTSTCDPATGACLPQSVKDGTTCDDNNLCTTAGTCAAGQCSSQPLIQCADLGPGCTISVCVPQTGKCVDATAPDGYPCEDGEPCTANDKCNDSQCVSGAAALCPDDGNPCTKETCIAGTGCQSEPVANGLSCDDNNVCTEDTTCQQGICKGGTEVQCPPDGDVCTTDACLPAQGCTYAPKVDGSPCDDGSSCTASDTCQNGTCKGTMSVQCPEPSGPCVITSCHPVTGACTEIPAANGTECDDSDSCTTADQCQSGECKGTPKQCPKSNDPCLIAGCQPLDGQCIFLPAVEGTGCDDNNLCTTNDACNGTGTCTGTLPDCPDPGIACMVGACDPQTGQCTSINSDNGTPCEDSDICIIGDFCFGGECVAGGSPKCLPSSPCQVAACNDKTGTCTETTKADGESCNDGNACSVNSTCNNGQCGGGSVITCEDDGNPCTTDQCDPLTGLCLYTPVNEGTQCNDGNKCTAVDACLSGTCAGVQKTCDTSQDKPCTITQCDAETGSCLALPEPDGAACDDDDSCTHNEICASGLCEGEPVLCPPTDTTCQTSTCISSEGCVLKHTNDGGSCNDNPCFLNTVCEEGDCIGGTPVNCAESTNPCEESYCSLTTGCTFIAKPDNEPCNDGNACTDSNVCIEGTCTGNTTECPVPNQCHVAFCDSDTGCTTKPATNGTQCDDNNPCTVNDTCQSGVCMPGNDKTCVGGNICQPEVCDPQTGLCLTATAKNDTPCDDGNLCTTDMKCVDGTCAGGKTLSCPTPENPCKTALCEPDSGKCKTYTLADGTICNDEDKCTAGDQCNSGHCIGSPAVVCGPPSECLIQICDPATGTCAPKMSDDGAPCDDGDLCAVAESCLNGICKSTTSLQACCASNKDCNDQLTCTEDSCIDGQCVHSPANLPDCHTRIAVVMGNKVQLYNSKTMQPVPTDGLIELPEQIVTLAQSDATGSLWVVTQDGSLHRIDALQPAQTTKTLLAKPATGVAIDDMIDRLIVLHPDGTISVREMSSNEQIASLWASPPLQMPALDTLSHRLFVPSKLGYLAVVDLNLPTSMLPETPWQIGGAPTNIAYDKSLDRLFAVDTQASRLRVLSAHYGLGAPGDPIDEGKTPLAVAVSNPSNGLFIAYKSVPKISRFNLDTLLKKTDPVWSIAGTPSALAHDSIGDRLLATTISPDQLWVTDAATTTGVSGSPVDLPASPSMSVIVRPSPGRLVINEAMVNPNGVSDTMGEWIEVYNPGSTPVDISGWKIATPSQSHVVSSDSAIVVQPSKFTVLCRNSELQTNGGVSCDYVYTAVMLANSGTTLQLFDDNNRLVDSAALTSPVPLGKSMALKHPAYHNDKRYSWQDSTSTPGAENQDVLDSL